jgi:hypothetical protein
VLTFRTAYVPCSIVSRAQNHWKSSHAGECVCLRKLAGWGLQQPAVADTDAPAPDEPVAMAEAADEQVALSDSGKE